MTNDKKELGVIEDTLFVPMLGRIYASENCRETEISSFYLIP